jgi:ribosomal protein S18 acetylase RimI-like enzyme
VTVVELRDRDTLAAVFRRRPLAHVYELGDLDDREWEYTRWFALDERGPVALLYTEPDVPVLLLIADDLLEPATDLLEALLPSLPDRVYAHLTPSLVEIARARYRVVDPEPHLKLGLIRVDLLDGPEVERLGPADLAEVESFYREAYPGGWFTPRMLGIGPYVGVREAGVLTCIAGVHVFSEEWRVAALGNVATQPARRGRGLARRACAALCRMLLEQGIESVALNVRADNAPALQAYRRLGFEPVADYVETTLEARDT